MFGSSNHLTLQEGAEYIAQINSRISFK